MDFTNEFIKGKVFSLCGKVGEKSVFNNERDEKKFFVSIITAGYQVNVDLLDELSLEKFPVAGVSVRCSGVATRKRNTIVSRLHFSSFIFEGDPKFVPISPDEFLSCGRWVVAAKVLKKSSGIYQQVPFYKYQVQTFGETFEYSKFSNVNFFGSLPESGNVILSGSFDSLLRTSKFNDNSVKSNELIFVVDKFQEVLSSPKK
ncbi:MAG: hypothetical protein LBE18_01305 [Planctomycetaceae bacterium]|jgi:hypothetical protein|nr:hypothetical protein [Planctomycetaceae bacterium]